MYEYTRIYIYIYRLDIINNEIMFQKIKRNYLTQPNLTLWNTGNFELVWKYLMSIEKRQIHFGSGVI